MRTQHCSNYNRTPTNRTQKRETLKSKERAGQRERESTRTTEQRRAKKRNECYLYVYFFISFTIQMIKPTKIFIYTIECEWWKRAVNCWRHFWKEIKENDGNFLFYVHFDAFGLQQTYSDFPLFCIWQLSDFSRAVNRTLILQIAANILNKLFSRFCVSVCARQWYGRKRGRNTEFTWFWHD